MAPLVLINTRLFTGGADLTSRSNKVEITSEAEDKDATTFGSGGWKELLGGLVASEISAEGLWEAGAPGLVDDEMWLDLGGLGPFTACPDGAAVGQLAYLTKTMTGKYGIGGAVGDIAPWQAEAKSSWPTVRGLLAHPPGTARTATGTGTGQQLGAVAAGRNLYACLHVLSVAGTTPSITVAIESDDTNGFGSPVTQLTFAAATAVGGQVLRVPGAITDTWWRPKWTITGTGGPSFLFALSFGIQ